MSPQLAIDRSAIADFCQRHHVRRLEFNPVDVDMPYGQARSFPSAAEALAHCVGTQGASAQRFVTAGS